MENHGYFISQMGFCDQEENMTTPKGVSEKSLSAEWKKVYSE
jgi:hypothetical protein